MKNKIKELREEKRMTQVRLSIELDVTQETVSAYEVGKHYPSVKALFKMVTLFDASLDYIMGLSDIRLPMKQDALPNDETQVLSIFRRLSDIQKGKTIAFMQGMLE